jgi:hypothetical protein
MTSRRLAAFILALILSVSLYADTTKTTTTTTSTTTPEAVPYGPAEFPEWQKDLRRAEIISFGALPFVTFFASIYYDVYRYYSHDQEAGYLPWPFKNSDTAVALTEDEQKNILLYSAGISVGVAIFDFGYRQISREIRMRKAERENSETDSVIQIEPVAGTTADTAPEGGESN